MNDQDNNNKNNLFQISGQKRKAPNVFQNTNLFHSTIEDSLNLTLGPPQSNDYYIPLPPPVLLSPLPSAAPPPPNNPVRSVRNRRTPSQTARESENVTITPPFEWATDKKAKIHTYKHLISKQITTITGQVQCKKCDCRYEMGFNLKEKFEEVGEFIIKNKAAMHDRAPEFWTNPVLPTCNICNAENSVKPVIAEKKRNINWLFLLLGKMLGCCTLEQLKYFCKHTNNHRTGAKDRVLYLAYLCMCKQLDPEGPYFNR